MSASKVGIRTDGWLTDLHNLLLLVPYRSRCWAQLRDGAGVPNAMIPSSTPSSHFAATCTHGICC